MSDQPLSRTSLGKAISKLAEGKSLSEAATDLGLDSTRLSASLRDLAARLHDGLNPTAKEIAETEDFRTLIDLLKKHGAAVQEDQREAEIVIKIQRNAMHEGLFDALIKKVQSQDPLHRIVFEISR